MARRGILAAHRLLVALGILVAGAAGALVVLRAGPAAAPTAPPGAASPQQTAAAPASTPSGSIPSPRAPASAHMGASSAASSGNVALPGAPEIVLFQRDGDDLKLLGWRAGETELGVRQVVAGALRGIAEDQGYVASLSRERSLLLVEAPPTTQGAPVTLRVFRLDGTGGALAWESNAFGSDKFASFVGPAQVLITPTALLPVARSWTHVDLSGVDPVVRELDLPVPLRPSPGASPDFDKLILNYGAVGTSKDGRYLYLVSFHGAPPVYRPAYRIEIATSTAVPIASFPTTGPTAIASLIVDSVSGRLVLAGARLTPGAGTVQAWSPGSSEPDFEIGLQNVLGAIWLGDGGLVTADYDRLPGPFTFEIVTIPGSGAPVETIYRAEGTNAAVIGVEHGFVAAYVTSRGSGIRTMVVIRLSDGATASADVTEPPGLQETNAGLRP